MKTHFTETESLWMATADTPHHPPLSYNAKADTCVIGAGIAGLTTAYLLAKAGRTVIVLEADRIGGRETRHTTAHIASALDDRYFNIESYHGERGAKLAADSHSAAIGLVASICEEEGLACGFRRLDGYLFLAPQSKISDLKREQEAATRAGLRGVTLVDRAPLDAFDTGPCLKFPDQGQFHPLLYVGGLACAAERLGVKFFERTRAVDVQSGKTVRVKTTGGNVITANDVVVATNSPFIDRVAIHTKQAPYRTYVIAAEIPAGSVPPALYWDTMDPYHYIRIMDAQSLSPEISKKEYLIIGGEDHKTGQDSDPASHFRKLEEWARARFTMMRNVRFRWSGQVLEPVDYMGFIGRNPMDADNVFIITGDSGNGMTHGTLGGKLISDLILGRKNPWAELYDPSRITLKAMPEFLRENFNVAAQYSDWLTGGELDSEKDLRPGQGGIVREGLRKIAMYRDEDGTLHRMSAMCTHLGCVVHWNDVEKSWDCPCHGSRFEAKGRVLNGPAPQALHALKRAKKTERA